MAVTTNAVNHTQAGVTMYSGATGVWSQGAYPMCHNIGIAYSGGTFTVQGSDGTALSATNPGYVTLQSKGTPGNLKTILVTANQTFTDGAAGTTDNARFGLTTGVNWANIPFFLYAVMDDTETAIAFMISRSPGASISPVSTSISKSGSIVNVDTRDFFSLANVTLTSYDANPVLCLGAFRMTFVGATDSWTVQTLTSYDGIGNFLDNIVFTMPTGVNGSAASTYFQANAGTVPQFGGSVLYWIYRDGTVRYLMELGACTVAGVGLQALNPTLPYANFSSGQDGIIGYYQTGAGVAYIVHVTSNGGATYLEGIVVSASAVPAGFFVNASIGIGDVMSFQFDYRPFNN